VSSVQNPVSPVKPKVGETNGDREYLMQVLRAATARAKLIANQLDTVGVALRQKAVRTPYSGALTKASLTYCNSARPPRLAVRDEYQRH
jgi:hypothetical protein